MKKEEIKTVQCAHTKCIRFLTSQRLHWALIFIGAVLRLEHYFEFRSFWFDEALEAVSTISRSFSEIIYCKPVILAYIKTPPLYLLINKVAINIFGNSEWVFRFFPQLASILSLFLFKSILNRYASALATTIALSFFAFSTQLIYYSAELKPYAGDIFFTLLFIWGIKYINDLRNYFRVFIYMSVAALSMWISFPSVFVIVAVGLTLLIKGIMRKNIKGICMLVISGSMAAFSFYLLYTMVLSSSVQHPVLLQFWSNHQAPHNIFSYEGFLWLKNLLMHVFQSVLEVNFPVLAAGLFLVGLVSISFRAKRESMMLLLLFLVLPIAAAIQHKYVLNARLMLFMVPVILIFFSEGIALIMRNKKALSLVLGLSIFCALISKPLYHSGYYFINEYRPEQNREMMRYLSKNYQNGDFIYIYAMTQFPYWYYMNRFGLNEWITKDINIINNYGEHLNGKA